MTKAHIAAAANAIADDIIASALEIMLAKPALSRTQAVELAIELMALDIDERTVA